MHVMFSIIEKAKGNNYMNFSYEKNKQRSFDTGDKLQFIARCSFKASNKGNTHYCWIEKQVLRLSEFG